ncbi:MAG: nucleoside triphosphate pyrophosphohydrolase [Alphaproteobacteria bacterium]|nr:nucleoside triphosphate pyrophosphohydrolase [Alphaproteobacteria bacterium]
MSKHPIEKLIEVMSALRDPENGCPWDIEQNFKTIAPYTIEEAYEVADAIERKNMKDLCEELGDLLLQPIYHAQMASEENIFDIYDVIQSVTDKMIYRHPHVFGNQSANSPEDVNKIWDERKNLEKENKSALDGVTKALPALLRAKKLQKKAAKVGFEWDKLDDVLDKLEEEIAEMREAIKTGTIEEKTDELGDILFVIANFARMLGVNPETALRQCNDKFEKRFRGMEKDFEVQNKCINDASLDQMKQMWQMQKSKE